MHNHPVGIVGASGFSGIELTRLLAAHPCVELRFVTSDRWVGESVEKRTGVGGSTGKLTYVAQDEGVGLSASCEVVLLATPAEASLKWVPPLLAGKVKVIDLSGAFRLRQADAYPQHYGFAHQAPQLLAEAGYGLPELFRAELAGRRLIANPGCYPTAAALSLFPLLRAGLIDPTSIVINAASGVTGAGRKASEDFSFTEVAGDFRAYRVLRHQHTPEISQTLSRGAGTEVPLTFTPHLLPVKRGILSTSFARLAPKANAASVAAAFADAYRAEPFVALAPSADEVSLKAVVGTNRCRLGFSCDGERLVVTGAIDNLVKGAAGQAVQNLNLLLGLEETTGLSAARGFYP
ncbi:MAG: N-acetyl-gamma-glutamyl-phosphate reductase [Myxococcota bacterium]